jgi:DNA primase
MDTTISVLHKVFGRPRKNNKVELEFNCPACDNGKNKYNLGINVEKMIGNCWSCHIGGTVFYLLKQFSVDRDIDFDAFRSKKIVKRERVKDVVEVELPTNFKHLSGNKSRASGIPRRYLHERGITEDIIKKWNIGYSNSSRNPIHNDRVIIPYYDEDEKLLYWVGRAFTSGVEPKYFSPPALKSELVFGEKFINWYSTVVLVEGVFDSLLIPNAIPMLGKYPSERLMDLLVEYKPNVIVCLDSDAHDDAWRLAKMINGLNLKSVRVTLIDDGDISDNYLESGIVGLQKLFKSSEKYSEFSMFKSRLGG